MKYDLFWLFILVVLVIIVKVMDILKRAATHNKGHDILAHTDEDDCSAWERAGESGISWR